MPGPYERPEGLVTWHGALWRMYAPAVPVPKPKVYTAYLSEAEKCGRVRRALTQALTQAELHTITGLTLSQVQDALRPLMRTGEVMPVRPRRGAWRYQRVR